nr:polyprotein [Fig fleck-associated virus 2]
MPIAPILIGGGQQQGSSRRPNTKSTKAPSSGRGKPAKPSPSSMTPSSSSSGQSRSTSVISTTRTAPPTSMSTPEKPLISSPLGANSISLQALDSPTTTQLSTNPKAVKLSSSKSSKCDESQSRNTSFNSTSPSKHPSPLSSAPSHACDLLANPAPMMTTQTTTPQYSTANSSLGPPQFSSVATTPSSTESLCLTPAGPPFQTSSSSAPNPKSATSASSVGTSSVPRAQSEHPEPCSPNSPSLSTSANWTSASPRSLPNSQSATLSVTQSGTSSLPTSSSTSSPCSTHSAGSALVNKKSLSDLAKSRTTQSSSNSTNSNSSRSLLSASSNLPLAASISDFSEGKESEISILPLVSTLKAPLPSTPIPSNRSTQTSRSMIPSSSPSALKLHSTQTPPISTPTSEPHPHRTLSHPNSALTHNLLAQKVQSYDQPRHHTSHRHHHPRSRPAPHSLLSASSSPLALWRSSRMATVNSLFQQLLSALNASNSDSTVLPGAVPEARLVQPPQLPPPPTASPKGSSTRLATDLPFQFNFYDVTGTETGSTTLDISSKDVVLKLLGPYRHGVLLSLEAVIMPSANAAKYPQTLDAVWSTADHIISASEILATYGGQRLTWGEASMNAALNLPADLSHLNPVIKDSTTYKDTPRLNLRFYQNPDSVSLGINAPISGSVIVRGVLRLSSPTNTPTLA